MKNLDVRVLEEICVLGSILIIEGGPHKLYTTITPYRSNENEEIFSVSLQRISR